MLIRICVWCGKKLKEVEEGDSTESICTECAKGLIDEQQEEQSKDDSE